MNCLSIEISACSAIRISMGVLVAVLFVSAIEAQTPGAADGLLRAEGYSASALRSLAVTARQQNRPEEAISLYREALKLEPRSFDICLSLAKLLAAQKNFAEAEKLLLPFQTPESAPILDVWEELGWTFLAEDRQPRAQLYFKWVINLAPERRSAYLGLASAFNKEGDFEQAIITYELWLEQHQEDFDVCILAGDSYLKFGNPKLAREHYRRALQILGNDSQRAAKIKQLQEKIENIDL